jgi:diguanylate cyclase (GGDEF)-like protein/PAS domain S-box-containing protein
VLGGKALDEGGEFFKSLLDNLTDGVYFVDRERRITYWNQGAERITGYESGEVMGRQCHENILMHMDGSGCLLCHGECPLVRTIEGGVIHESEVFLHHKKGHRIPVWVRVSPIKDRAGEIVGAVEVFNDNSAKVAAIKKIEELEDQALLDPLTGLGNRRYAEITLSDRLSDLSRHGWSFGALFIDVDCFKAINDNHGHEVGDMVLKMVAETLLRNTRANDFIGRWGGEEFLAVVVNVNPEKLTQVAERFRRLVGASSMDWQEHRLKVTISVGATMAKADDSSKSLVMRADALMYESKAGGRNRVTIG